MVNQHFILGFAVVILLRDEYNAILLNGVATPVLLNGRCLAVHWVREASVDDNPSSHLQEPDEHL